MQNIKNYMEKEVPMLMLCHILFLIYLLKIFDVSTLYNDNLDMVELLITILNSTIFSSILYILTIILDGTISSVSKDNLLYLFRLCKKPGENVFSEIKTKDNDSRFTYCDIKKKYSHIYDNMPQEKKVRYKYENKEWYKIYSKYREQSMVFYSQREYLMFRDMYILNILLTIIYILFSYCFNLISFDIRYVLYLVVFIIIFNIVARKKAKRFVFNVIAIDVEKQ